MRVIKSIRSKGKGRSANCHGKALQEDIFSNRPIRDALRPIMNHGGIFHHAPASGILSHDGFVVAWENHRDVTHKSQVYGTREKAEQEMAEMVEGDKSHPSFAPVRLNLRVEPENGNLIEEDSDGVISRIKIRN